MLIPLLALAPSCAATSREVRLQEEGGETVVHVAESGGQPIEIPEPELWGSFRKAAREVVVKADPLAAAEEVFGLTEGSGTYRYYARSGFLVPETGGGLEELENAAERMTREYQEWCGGTSMRFGDCLRLLAHSNVLTLHGRYVVTLVMAMTASFGPMLDSLKDFADPNAVAVMLASAVAIYILLLLVPEPISKLISLGITGALIGYMGLTMFWELVYGARAMATAVDAATEFSQLRGAAREFGKVLGPQMGQLLILLVSHGLGKGIAAKGTAGLPRFAEASAQAQRLVRVRLAAAGAVRSVTLGAGVITISMATGAMAVGAPSGEPPVQKPGETAPTLRNLGRQLAAEEAAGAFKANGELTDEAIRGAYEIFEPGSLGNPAIPKVFGKYGTKFFRSPSGWFQVHFYYNPATKEVFYGLDYKAVFRNGVTIYTPGGS